MLRKWYSQPTNITNIVKPFSISVLGATFPNPTLVSEVHVKYKAVIYLDLKKTNKGISQGYVGSFLTNIYHNLPHGWTSGVVIRSLDIISERIQPSDRGVKLRPFPTADSIPERKR